MNASAKLKKIIINAGMFYLYQLIAVVLICYVGMGVRLIGELNGLHQ
jgi:hypothetical protein